MFSIPYYHDYISPELARHLLSLAEPVAGVAGLVQVGKNAGLENPEALRFLTELYAELEPELQTLLRQRQADRKFLDERTSACHQFNRELGRDWLHPDYKTVIGLEDAKGRVVIGPKRANYCGKGGAAVAPLPEFLQGPHVTLFGPPDSAKMAINAMNSFHRKLPNEPEIVGELLRHSPMWGADDEDSKTPLRADLVDAAMNLTSCFAGDLTLEENGKRYELAKDHLALPIKRFPGLALPSTFLFYKKNPIPLHLYDFALHLFRNWHNPRALVFYVPKLENEEEAAYIHKMIAAAERRIRFLHQDYKEGSVRLMVVLENPRAILRAHEIMDALHPYFAGASLGWHDYLASTARIFKNDSNYRIPVKADPDIVIKYIKASHLLLAEAVGSRGGIKVGGMYGILPLPGHPDSLQVTLKGFFKDVITQMKRDLSGFWVAHPDFVRLGLAIVEAWRRRTEGDRESLEALVSGLLEPKHIREVLNFIESPDIEGLDSSDPNYVRSLIVADISESDFIANNHPDEIRYNVFQSLQYLTDWLSGNGCVALPTNIGEVPVRVMDDLATAERSRWEVWHELRHGRFPVEEFIQIAHEEMSFIRRDLSDDKKIVQVKWDERTAKWYPVAMRIMLQLMTDPEPCEFATELLMPFTVEAIRKAEDPLLALKNIDPGKLRLERYVEDYHHYFEICGSQRFAKLMAQNPVEDLKLARETILNFSLEDVLVAASFHGDIGQSKKTLDATAAGEQARVIAEGDEHLEELREVGGLYKRKFGMKFLISAKGKSAGEILASLKKRIQLHHAEELDNARMALWEISAKRLADHPRPTLQRLEEIRRKHSLVGTSIALNYRGLTQAIPLGEAELGKAPVRAETPFQIASLSKTVASGFALDFFRAYRIPLSTPVNELLARAQSSFRLGGEADWADRTTLAHLMNHSALNMHYVKGFPELPPVAELVAGGHGYEKVETIAEPGTKFHYSGGGFLLLEHLIGELAPRVGRYQMRELARLYLDHMGLTGFSFFDAPANLALGYMDNGAPAPKLRFPAFAAGAYASAPEMAQYLRHFSSAYASVTDLTSLSHDTAVQMAEAFDRGCRDFMGCDMGLGVFVVEAGPNKLIAHQGANEGFRALYLQCFSGPDAGKGFVIFCNGDNNAVPAIAAMAKELWESLSIQGADFSRLGRDFDQSNLPQEQIVNLGYKTLLFDAFLPSLPEPIAVSGPADPLADFNLLSGAEILSCTNQKFARAENLISPFLPVFDPELFGRQGKIMDSWESARHNPLDADQLHLRLKKPGEAKFVSLSTKYHDGNNAEFVRLLGFDGEWYELLPKTRLQPHSILELELPAAKSVRELKVEIYPDGGFTRLGLYGDLPPGQEGRFLRNARAERFPDLIPKTNKPLTIPYAPTREEITRNKQRAVKVDFASSAFGAAVVKASNEHYGPAAQVVSPFPPLHMFDGLESARSRVPGHNEEVVIRLSDPVQIGAIELDFSFFVNNNPLFVAVSALHMGKWIELVPKTRVKAFAGNKKEFKIAAKERFEQVKVLTFPDGGINRIKVFGSLPV